MAAFGWPIAAQYTARNASMQLRACDPAACGCVVDEPLCAHRVGQGEQPIGGPQKRHPPVECLGQLVCLDIGEQIIGLRATAAYTRGRMRE